MPAYNKSSSSKSDSKTQQLISEMPVFAQDFFDHLLYMNKSPGTLLQYAYDMKLFFAYCASHLNKKPSDQDVSGSAFLDSISLKDTQKYTEWLRHYNTDGSCRTKPLSDSSLARRMCSLRAFFRYYAEQGRTSSSLGKEIKVTGVPYLKTSPLSSAYETRLFQAVMSTSGMSEKQAGAHRFIEKRDYAIISIFLCTGMKLSDLVSIDLEDIDFVTSAIRTSDKNGNTIFAPVNQNTIEALHAYIDQCCRTSRYFQLSE